MPASLSRTGSSLRAFTALFANADLRRIELAWSGSIVGQWGYEIALAVYAYRAGGAGAVGLLALARLLPAAVVAPFAALLSDRFSRRRVMVLADLARAAAMGGAAAAVLAEAPDAVVYALAVCAALAGTAFAPAQAALLPALARSPAELTAANTTSTTIESAAFFVGPALGGVLVAVTSIGAVFALTAVLFVWSALVLTRIRGDSRGESVPAAGSIVHEALAGFRAIGGEGRLRLVVGLYGAQTLTAGIMRVLLVVTALELLDLGASGVGFLNSASGIGALGGTLVLAVLIATRRLAAVFGAGVLLWGLPLVVLAIHPHVALALLCFGILGVGNTLADVAGLTLLQRATPDELRARVFGVLESVFLATIGIGAVLAPLLISAFGPRGALLAAGTALSGLVLLLWRPLAQLDAAAPGPAAEVALLRRIPIFSPLPQAALERIASHLTPVRIAASKAVFHKGDPGDRFYVVSEGKLTVAVDDGEAVLLGPGDAFGEIALLRNVPRTATVTALTDADVYALEGDVFIAAVTGHAPSADAADAVIAGHLGSGAAGAASWAT